MGARWWSFVLGLVCMPAQVVLSLWTASQDPASTSYMKLNSSLEIRCSTSHPQLLGLALHRYFQRGDPVIFLALVNGKITKDTISPNFKGRIQWSGGPQRQGGEYTITLQLSLQKLDDTDLYYCMWTNMVSSRINHLSSKGTVVIVTEHHPQERCVSSTLDFTLIFLSFVALILFVSFSIGVLFVRCRRSKKKFAPPRPPRPDRPHHVCRPQPPQHCPYLVTSINNTNLNGVM